MLYKMAERFDASGRKQMLPFKYLYRNRPGGEFEAIQRNGNVMYPRLKDRTGDVCSPINGNLRVLSFCANVLPSTLDPPEISPFGDTRLSIPFAEILHNCNLYLQIFTV